MIGNLQIGNLKDCCNDIKQMIAAHEYEKCETVIIRSMERYPHSAIPHNLYGILLEREHNHLLAMKHFRAAYALDPTYIPARYNMEQYRSISGRGIREAYTEEDCAEICEKKRDKQFYVKYDEHHIGHIVRK